MDLWLVRHAAAEARAASGQDRDRALTPEGFARAEAAARGLARIEPDIESIVASPYRRARQTAEVVARALRLTDGIELSECLEPEHAPQEILGQLEGRRERGLLLVGHQPHLGWLLGLLVSGEDTEIPLGKLTFARVELSGGSGALRAVLPPNVLELLGRPQ